MGTKFNSTLESHKNCCVKITWHLRCLLIFTQQFSFLSWVFVKFLNNSHLRLTPLVTIIPTIPLLATYCHSISGIVGNANNHNIPMFRQAPVSSLGPSHRGPLRGQQGDQPRHLRHRGRAQGQELQVGHGVNVSPWHYLLLMTRWALNTSAGTMELGQQRTARLELSKHQIRDNVNNALSLDRTICEVSLRLMMLQ